MVHGLLLQFMAGMIVIGAIINLPAWIQLLVQRLREVGHPKWFYDAYFYTRLGMVVQSPGVAVAYAVFNVNNFLNNNHLEPFLVYFLSRSMTALGEFVFIIAAFIIGLKRPLYVYVITSSIWASLCTFWYFHEVL